VANGEQGRGKKPTAKPTGWLPKGCIGVPENDTHRALEVVLCQTPLDLAAVKAVGLTAYRLKCQGEWRNTGLGPTKLEFVQNFTMNQDRIMKNISW
jgi:hypothetical protein